MLDPILAKLPAQLHQLTIAIGGKVDQPLQRPFELDTHAVEVRDSFQQLHLGAADSIASLLPAVLILRPGPGSFRFVLRDARLVFELWQERGELGDLRHDPAHARQLVVRLLDRVRAEPLHRSTIAPRRQVLFWLQERHTSIMDSTEMRRRVEAARVARLATAGADGRPHIVPISFALDGDRLYFAVDAKPKRTANLKRLRNIADNPSVSILIDHYEEDWEQLWWVRLDGKARVVGEEAEIQRALDLLVQRYAQYRATRPTGPVVAVSIEGMSGWSFS